MSDGIPAYGWIPTFEETNIAYDVLYDCNYILEVDAFLVLADVVTLVTMPLVGPDKNVAVLKRGANVA